jgi:predicted nucleic acid-binding protein
VRQPSLPGIARWTARGLTAYDACYVALAEERGVQLVTADELIISVGGTRIRSLSAQPES